MNMIWQRQIDAMGKEALSRVEELMNSSRINDLLHKREEDEKKKNCILWVLAIIGAVAAVAGIAYAVYRFFTPDYLEDFEDDFDDDFDDIPSSKSYKKAEKQTAATKQPKSAKQTSTASSKVTPMYNVKKPASSSEVCVIKPKQFDDATES